MTVRFIIVSVILYVGISLDCNMNYNTIMTASGVHLTHMMRLILY